MAAQCTSLLCLLLLSTVLLLTLTAAQNDVDSLSIDSEQVCDNGKVSKLSFVLVLCWQFTVYSFVWMRIWGRTVIGSVRMVSLSSNRWGCDKFSQTHCSLFVAWEPFFFYWSSHHLLFASLCAVHEAFSSADLHQQCLWCEFSSINNVYSHAKLSPSSGVYSFESLNGHNFEFC